MDLEYPERHGGLGLISWRIFLRYTQQIQNLVSKVADYNPNGIPPGHWKFLNVHIYAAEIIAENFINKKLITASIDCRILKKSQLTYFP